MRRNRMGWLAIAGSLALLAVGTIRAANVNRVIQRDLQEYIMAQGLPPFLGDTTLENRDVVASVDSVGSLDRFLNLNLGTMVTGSITDRPLPDGRSLVTVITHTRNAYAVVVEFMPAGPPVVMFGQFMGPFDPELFGIGDFNSVVRYISPYPGAPIPDVHQVGLGNMPGYELVSVIIEGVANGPLWEEAGLGPDGTPGKMILSITRVLQTPTGKPFDPYVWRGRVNLRAVGK